MIESLTEKMGDVEKIVHGHGKEERTKAGSSGDVPEEDKSMGDKADNDNAEDDKAEDDKAEEASRKPGRQKRGKVKESKAKEASPQVVRWTRANAKATGVSNKPSTLQKKAKNQGKEVTCLVLERWNLFQLVCFWNIGTFFSLFAFWNVGTLDCLLVWFGKISCAFECLNLWFVQTCCNICILLVLFCKVCISVFCLQKKCRVKVRVRVRMEA